MPNAHRIPAKKAWAGTKTWLAWRKDDVCASDHLPLIRDLSNAPSVAPRLIPALTNARIAVPLPLPLREWRPLRASPPCRALREPRVPPRFPAFPRSPACPKCPPARSLRLRPRKHLGRRPALFVRRKARGTAPQEKLQERRKHGEQRERDVHHQGPGLRQLPPGQQRLHGGHRRGAGQDPAHPPVPF